MSIITRKGDDGTTSLLYGGRVRKDDPRIEAVGTLDELNVEIGAVKLFAKIAGDEVLKARMMTVQDCLVALMGEVACAPGNREKYILSGFPTLGTNDLERLDNTAKSIEEDMPPAKDWIRPGNNPLALSLDRARVAARRAERRLVGIGSSPLSLQWINRLSDLLWLLAYQAGKP
jgi:cob(I)alamin adenosyltransferase